MDGSCSGNNVGSCHADDDGDRAAILAGNQTPTKKRKTRTRRPVLVCTLGCGGHPYWHPAAPRGLCLVPGTSCFRSGPVLVRSRSSPGPVLVRSGPSLVRSWSGPVWSGPGSSGRADGRVRVRVRVQRRLGAVAQPYRSTGGPPKRLAAQSLRRSPKGRVGGPNATTTILRPRSQGGIASGVAIVRRNRRQRRGRGLPLPPSHNSTDRGEVRPISPVP